MIKTLKQKKVAQKKKTNTKRNKKRLLVLNIIILKLDTNMRTSSDDLKNELLNKKSQSCKILLRKELQRRIYFGNRRKKRGKATAMKETMLVFTNNT